MPSQREVANRFAKLLKRTSVKMQKVVSRPMPKFPPPADSEKIPHPLRTYDIRYTDGPDHDAFCSELHLNEDHLNNIELIVKYRQITFATLSAVAHDDSREGRKKHILQRMQDVETRSIIFLALPPKNTGGWTEAEMAEQVNAVLQRFLEQAEACAEEAENLINGETSPEEGIDEDAIQQGQSLDAERLPKNLQIPGFSQKEARAINREVDEAVFDLLSNPELRSATSLVKMIVVSACSQITGSDPDHCLGRLKYLLTFFEGCPVRPPGGGHTATTEFTLTEDLGSDFAWHCLLNSALAQAERQFAHSLNSVLPFAAVLSTLLARHPEQIPRYIARMATACPLLTSYADGPMCETDIDEFELHYWRGAARLFAAVALARSPPEFKGQHKPDFLNPRLLWLTIAGIARHPFVPMATAEVLHGLVEVCGFALTRLYGRQALRLFRTLSATINDSPELAQSAPELALVACLDECLSGGEGESAATTKQTSRFYGFLLDDFWN